MSDQELAAPTSTDTTDAPADPTTDAPLVPLTEAEIASLGANERIELLAKSVLSIQTAFSAFVKNTAEVQGQFNNNFLAIQESMKTIDENFAKVKGLLGNTGGAPIDRLRAIEEHLSRLDPNFKPGLRDEPKPAAKVESGLDIGHTE